MKVCIVLSALMAASIALPATPAAPSPVQAPATAAAWRPSGRLLLLPARLQNPTPADNTTTTQQAQPDESQSARLLDSGEYYVLLPDGRLQMVKYTTAALPAAESGKQASAESQLPARQQEAEPFAKFQIEYFQFPPSQVSQVQPEEEESAQVKAEEEAESGFEANVQYRDVKPISGPIYAYNPAPLVRIVRSQDY